MREIHVAICDDEPYFLEELERHIQRYAEEKKTGISVDTYTDAMGLEEKVYKEKDSYQLILMDIEMPQRSGVEAARRLRSAGFEDEIGFVTLYDSYALEAFEVDAVGYVVKPVRYEELERLIDKAVACICYRRDKVQAEERFLEVVVHKRSVMVDMEKVFYIEKRRNQCIFHFSSEELTCYETLGNIYTKLNQERFMYSHQGYIVNFDKIKEVKRNAVCFGEEKEAPVSRKYQNEIKERHMDKIYRLRKELINGKTAL